jgi:hypothetical protein
MFWPNVGRQYLKFYREIAAASRKRRERLFRTVFSAPALTAISGNGAI